MCFIIWSDAPELGQWIGETKNQIEVLPLHLSLDFSYRFQGSEILRLKWSKC